MIDPADVARAHDAMEREYDAIDDPWYAHLVNEIHRFLVDELPPGAGGTALDVGCGTGLQTTLLARAGYAARGFDLARELVERARRRQADPHHPDWGLYRTRLEPFLRDQRAIAAQADRLRGAREIVAPDYFVGDATDPAAYGDGRYDVVVCCGSVLSFIDDHQRTLELMSRALRPGGLLFLEVEQRTNLDLVWPLIDRAAGGRLEYEQSWSETLANLAAPPGRNLRIDYPFHLADGGEVVLPLWLFSVAHLRRAFAAAGLRERARVGIHAVTNLLPSTLLHHADLGPSALRLVRALARVERRLARRWPLARLGCSVLYCLERRA